MPNFGEWIRQTCKYTCIWQQHCHVRTHWSVLFCYLLIRQNAWNPATVCKWSVGTKFSGIIFPHLENFVMPLIFAWFTLSGPDYLSMGLQGCLDIRDQFPSKLTETWLGPVMELQSWCFECPTLSVFFVCLLIFVLCF